jgi:hypothetical protein
VPNQEGDELGSDAFRGGHQHPFFVAMDVINQYDRPPCA